MSILLKLSVSILAVIAGAISVAATMVTPMTFSEAMTESVSRSENSNWECREIVQ